MTAILPRWDQVQVVGKAGGTTSGAFNGSPGPDGGQGGAGKDTSCRAPGITNSTQMGTSYSGTWTCGET
ncbi:hypothetical protein RUM44_000258 [Polyplax serrata]|uniref:Uncharacterized protein n=1 Tax=Polyplax serrata TaxID=468196 RepID=A0ABR1B519_POLSC